MEVSVVKPCDIPLLWITLSKLGIYSDISLCYSKMIQVSKKPQKVQNVFKLLVHSQESKVFWIPVQKFYRTACWIEGLLFKNAKPQNLSSFESLCGKNCCCEVNFAPRFLTLNQLFLKRRKTYKRILLIFLYEFLFKIRHMCFQDISNFACTFWSS